MTNTAEIDFTDPQIITLLASGTEAMVTDYVFSCIKEGAYGDLEDLYNALFTFRGEGDSLLNIVARAWPTEAEWAKLG